MQNTMDVNLKVLLMDTDFYAQHAVNSFLAWDRRTRVTNLSENLDDMWMYIDETPLAEMPDIVLLEADHIGSPAHVMDTIRLLKQKIEGVRVICLAQKADSALVEAAAESGADGFLLKHEIRFQIAWAIVYSLDHDFIVTPGIHKACADRFNHRIFHATILPEMRHFPELTTRVQQALKLCVLDGMPAHLAADEMGISLHTIRGYIKEGYRILEAYDDTEYPTDMTPQERAFMRITAFADDENEEEEETSASHNHPHTGD